MIPTNEYFVKTQTSAKVFLKSSAIFEINIREP
jgi:hypothetical protein